MHIVVFFLADMGVLHTVPVEKQFWKAPIEKELWKVPIKKGICTDIHTHICTFQPYFYTYSGASQSPYREGVLQSP